MREPNGSGLGKMRCGIEAKPRESIEGSCWGKTKRRTCSNALYFRVYNRLIDKDGSLVTGYNKNNRRVKGSYTYSRRSRSVEMSIYFKTIVVEEGLSGNDVHV